MVDAQQATSVDAHAHLVPLSFLNMAQASAKSLGVEVERTPAGHAVSFPNIPKLRPAGGKLVDLAGRDEWLASVGAKHQVTGAWTDMVGYTLPPQRELDWVRLLNEHIASDAAGAGAAFSALATIPMRSGDAAAVELEYAVNRLGMVGAMLSSDPVDIDVAAPELESFWQEAAALDVPVLLHGASHSKFASFGPPYLGYSLGRTFDTSVLVAKLVLGGLLDRHPKLRLVLCHGGGALPYLIGRIEDGYQRGTDRTAQLERNGPTDYMPDLYYDTVTLNERSLRFLMDFVGAGHIMLGSDWVWGPMAGEFAGPAEAVATEAELSSIRSGTARSLFGTT